MNWSATFAIHELLCFVYFAFFATRACILANSCPMLCETLS